MYREGLDTFGGSTLTENSYFNLLHLSHAFRPKNLACLVHLQKRFELLYLNKETSLGLEVLAQVMFDICSNNKDSSCGTSFDCIDSKELKEMVDSLKLNGRKDFDKKDSDENLGPSL